MTDEEIQRIIKEQSKSKTRVEIHKWDKDKQEFNKELSIGIQEDTYINIGHNADGKFIQIFKR